MKDWFDQSNNSWIPVNSQNNKSAAQLKAEEICKAMGMSKAAPTLVDANDPSPFWINGTLILVASDKTTQAEIDAVNEAAKKNAKVIVVEYDDTAKKVINKTIHAAKDLAKVHTTPMNSSAPTSDIEDLAELFGVDLDDPSLSGQEKEELEKMLKHMGSLSVMINGKMKKVSQLTPQELADLNKAMSASSLTRRNLFSGSCGGGGCGSSYSSGCGSSYSSGCGSSYSSGCGSSGGYYSSGCGGSSGSHC